MSLITRCPACGTMFKVVPDQLRISEGWVRCGHCAEVFDASSHMQGDAAAVQTTAPTPMPPLEEPEASWDLPPAPVSAPEPAPEPEPGYWSEPHIAPEPVSAPVMVAEPATPDSYLQAVDALARATPAPEPDPGPVSDLSGIMQGDMVDGMPDAPPALEDVSFVRQARRKAFWRRPVVRVTLGLALVLLLVSLTLQVAVQERDRIAAAQPALKPLLQQLCEPLQCRVGPPRQIEAVVIDGSTFSKLRGDAYRLSFTLRNQAQTDIAMPAIELTLTDGQDQPVVRRVLNPADMGQTSGLLPAGADWSGSLAMSVAGNGSGRIAGYRMLAFYP